MENCAELVSLPNITQFQLGLGRILTITTVQHVPML
jgi:hypothetical protein